MADYTLTPNKDVLVGTSGSDVFTVPTNNANLAAEDEISGSGGRDTLLFVRGGAVSVSTERLSGLDSIEVLDFSASATLLLSLDEATLAQSGQVSAVTGGQMLDVVTSGGTLQLDLRGTDPESDNLVRVSGGGIDYPLQRNPAAGADRGLRRGDGYGWQWCGCSLQQCVRGSPVWRGGK